ncbi:endonuclease domain-containing 1 protein-like [Mytilus trossulus]|uniref:endonuclease domain-containing 1 protein-like n=1 Tax=Mytilus trossulus TaxID=6551 RepID=UPI0030069980
MIHIFGFVVIILSFNFVKSEVSPNFTRCKDRFFYQNTAPTLKGLVGSTQICQRLGNQYYYATEYDTTNRIPYYSANTLSFDRRGRRIGGWFVEPQLSNENDPSMVDISMANNDIATFGIRQAVNVDYTRSGYDRGHLNPQLYNCETEDSRKATNSLTNIAPQVSSFNQGIWNVFETTLYNISKKYCNFVGARRYFITGVLPSKNQFISNERVNIPSHYWTAVCCDSSSAKGDLRKEGWSAGFIGENKANSSVFIYTIQNFLQTTSSTLFADFTDQNGNTVKNCLFNPTKADNIINEIANTDNRFIKGKTSMFRRVCKLIYDGVCYILGLFG